jgi:hypothetical protein
VTPKIFCQIESTRMFEKTWRWKTLLIDDLSWMKLHPHQHNTENIMGYLKNLIYSKVCGWSYAAYKSRILSGLCRTAYNIVWFLAGARGLFNNWFTHIA